jgi:hypothetical protein
MLHKSWYVITLVSKPSSSKSQNIVLISINNLFLIGLRRWTLDWCVKVNPMIVLFKNMNTILLPLKKKNASKLSQTFFIIFIIKLLIRYIIIFIKKIRVLLQCTVASVSFAMLNLQYHFFFTFPRPKNYIRNFFGFIIFSLFN